MLKLKISFLLLATLLLSGCGDFGMNETPTQQGFKAAAPVTAPAMPVTPQVIYPSKIQLQHTSINKNPKGLSGETVVQRANKKALVAPTPADTAKSTIVFPYEPGDLYEVYTTPLNITDIELEAGENIISFGAGDTSRWQISRTMSGSGANQIEHLVIKPLSEDLDTSMIITTNLRTYHLLLKSTKNTFMASVKWQYADEGSLESNNAAVPIATAAPSSLNSLGIPQFDFGYHMKVTKGDSPDWYPTAVFNDGMKTYIEFPKRIQSAPALFIKDSRSGDAAVNYRVINNYYIVDQVFTAAELMSGNGDTIVSIHYGKN